MDLHKELQEYRDSEDKLKRDYESQKIQLNDERTSHRKIEDFLDSKGLRDQYAQTYDNSKKRLIKQKDKYY